ncbi:hypothetical protein GGR50DRAFT_660993 [Xylaria sp. CBS 124048]|nr:hypothetical protein GGR50DRAFT_660993 [Xylaria sp. CBS 124048]
MSSHQSKPSLARAQSLRVPAKPTLTAPPPPSASPITKSPQVPVCTSNANLFLTNLRLLELDLEPDWPDITPTTLSSKDAAGGQKKRIQCVEWALYRLFLLWDHADTQSKLQPFFPPADQVQSINLRAALVRNLETLKKNGLLGRDVLIRKTMLDECRGERLEEVLAVFSSVVLKKLVAERAINSGIEYRPTISESISLESWGYKSDRTQLNGLLLAHKASLRSILDQKNAARQKYRDFEELLAMKERRIARRREQAKSNAQAEAIVISDVAKTEIRRILRNNWTGNEHWLDGLLGSGTSQKGGLLNTPFDDVWSGVKEGSIADFEDQTTGLLEQLEKRVHRQQTRLQKWKAFRNSAFGDVRPKVTHDPLPEDEKSDSGFDFTAHLDLESVPSAVQFDNPPPQYTRLFSGLTAELEGLKETKLLDFSSLGDGTRRAPPSIVPKYVPQAEVVEEPEQVSDLSDWEDETESVTSLPKARESSTTSGARPTVAPGGVAGYKRQLPRIRISSADLKSRPVVLDNQAKSHAETRRPRKESRTVQAGPLSSTEDLESEFTSRRLRRKASYSSLAQLPCQAITNDTSPPAASPQSPTQALADEILTSMNNVSPSPKKKSRYTLSLAERARMSIARKISFEKEEELPELLPIKPNRVQQEHNDHTTEADAEQEEDHEDLVARTRRSMAGFEAARQKAQLERRRSQRRARAVQKQENHFSRFDEDTVGDVSVVEELMEDGQGDYEAVFKSRPRIATSPAPGPKD